jgi:hypothetical protein
MWQSALSSLCIETLVVRDLEYHVISLKTQCLWVSLTLIPALNYSRDLWQNIKNNIHLQTTNFSRVSSRNKGSRTRLEMEKRKITDHFPKMDTGAKKSKPLKPKEAGESQLKGFLLYFEENSQSVSQKVNIIDEEKVREKCLEIWKNLSSDEKKDYMTSRVPKRKNDDLSQFPEKSKLWLKIFGHLDWKNLQEKATLVCKSWLKMIRECPKLSGELSLKSDNITKTKQGKEDLIAILSRWKELKVLHAVNGNDFDFKGIKFSNYPNLRKVVVLKQLPGENFKGFPTKSPEWFYSSEVIMDPQVTPQLVNSLQSLKKSKISPDSVKELTLRFISYYLRANLDEQGTYILIVRMRCEFLYP